MADYVNSVTVEFSGISVIPELRLITNNVPVCACFNKICTPERSLTVTPLHCGSPAYAPRYEPFTGKKTATAPGYSAQAHTAMRCARVGVLLILPCFLSARKGIFCHVARAEREATKELSLVAGVCGG